MKIYHFDLGLSLYASELSIIVNEIFPNLNIKDYHAFGFEPCKESYTRCAKLFRNNPNVTIIKRAIASKKGTAKLYHCFARKGYRPGGNSIYESKCNVRSDVFEKIACVRFSEWLEKAAPDFRKTFNILRFNIEGAEWPLFNDLEKNDLIKHFNIFCGSVVGVDIKKVKTLKPKLPEYLSLLKRNNVTIFPFAGHNRFDLQSHISKLMRSKNDTYSLLP